MAKVVALALWPLQQPLQQPSQPQAEWQPAHKSSGLQCVLVLPLSYGAWQLEEGSICPCQQGFSRTPSASASDGHSTISNSFRQMKGVGRCKCPRSHGARTGEQQQGEPWKLADFWWSQGIPFPDSWCNTHPPIAARSPHSDWTSFAAGFLQDVESWEELWTL